MVFRGVPILIIARLQVLVPLNNALQELDTLVQLAINHCQPLSTNTNKIGTTYCTIAVLHTLCREGLVTLEWSYHQGSVGA